MEKTFFIIKPDGVRRSLIGHVIARVEIRGFTLEKLEMRDVSREMLDRHYADLVDKPFYPEIVSYMTSGPVVIGVLKGSDVIHRRRGLPWVAPEPQLLISTSTPADRSSFISASRVCWVGSRMSSRRLWVRISNCSRDFLSVCGDRSTQYLLIFVGSGIGPATLAPVLF